MHESGLSVFNQFIEGQIFFFKGVECGHSTLHACMLISRMAFFALREVFASWWLLHSYTCLGIVYMRVDHCIKYGFKWFLIDKVFYSVDAYNKGFSSHFKWLLNQQRHKL